ncbi:hypothetical protein KAFR_0C06070 [Kazachstania africana CBS 2517]|uniref:Tom6p n=1 Tax=Kazachstania africana (strain ATCC 22294 / BCRC 22015 / CBS 2517 / CECT 1963 / NBRC 1671 / NRRL Y-8276) TaxID=1071382 RepID=H2AT98_KAZAF|nr:hypothetical protein KAFR_0C06070 [Kazachstania africana CBS 2517]CCF57598.1 hypothetical protein KAFR_0C06070 [Kazachstania africana CBS 2517]
MFSIPANNANMGGIPTSAPSHNAKSKFQRFRETPAYTMVLNGAFFIAGVAFIQSPLMDMLAPQL